MRPYPGATHLTDLPVSLASEVRAGTESANQNATALEPFEREALEQADAPFSEIPGLGPKLAARVREQLGIRTVEQLELAAHTGRLQTVAGIGPGRARRIREQLGARFKQMRQARQQHCRPLNPEPPVAELLSVDHEYRVKARAGTLRRVAPKRLNPTGAAWLPVLNTTRGATHYTAFFSNTATAHRLHKTHQWVVILAERSGCLAQYTVVNETRGSWHGERVVRGRESECRSYYATRAA